MHGSQLERGNNAPGATRPGKGQYSSFGGKRYLGKKLGVGGKDIENTVVESAGPTEKEGMLGRSQTLTGQLRGRKSSGSESLHVTTAGQQPRRSCRQSYRHSPSLVQGAINTG